MLRRAGATNLGAAYHTLWTAAAISTLGDGVYLTGLPLLAASLTRDPLRVSIVGAASWLPWVLLGLPAGALVDRWDRRGVMWRVDTGRFLVVGALAVVVLAGWASIWLLAAAGLLLGAGQVLFDSAAQAILPTMLARDPRRLERANSQLLGTQQVGEQLAGRPLGGLLFSLATAVPFAVDAVSFAVSSLLLITIPGRFAVAAGDAPGAPRPRRRLRAEIAEGLRWLIGHPLFRTMAVVVSVTNLSVSASDAILVLFALEDLKLHSVGFGLLLAGFAVGGILGSVVATRVSRLIGPGAVFVSALLVGALALAGVGATSDPLVAGALLAVEGAVFTIFNIVAITLRQAIVPDRLTGRVVATNRLIVFGTIPFGSILGGVLGRTISLRAPFLGGAAVLLATALLALPRINNRTVNAAQLTASASEP
ncbi:MAG TPA: MFS transporter [Actinomycetota bacterium]